MQLILMRHADAEVLDARHYPNDNLRPLSALGCEVQQKMAQAIKRMGLKPDYIVTSPRLRTLQTAGITAKELGLADRLTLSSALGQDYSVTAVLDMLARHDRQETILCVGHDPDLCELASALLGMTESPSIKFPKSAMMGIKFHDQPGAGAGVLRFFYRPEDLVALL